jgi:DNA uptake protein ComE-like DNA-binding protein
MPRDTRREQSEVTPTADTSPGAPVEEDDAAEEVETPKQEVTFEEVDTSAEAGTTEEVDTSVEAGTAVEAGTTEEAGRSEEAETSEEDKKPGLIGRILGVDGDEGDEPKDEKDEKDEDQAEEDEAEGKPSAEPAATAGDEPIDLNRASFEQLRDLGFSVTQSTQLLTYRERQGGFESVDDLAGVPGVSAEFLSEVTPKLRVG